jgi:RNA polymerase sigma factor (sigma-70 family)
MTAPSRADAASSALDLVLGRFRRLVRAVGSRHGLDDHDLDELIQDVRIRLWQARPGETIGAPPSSYVYQAARSATLDLIRRRRRADRLEPLESAEPGNMSVKAEAPDRLAEQGELAELVFQSVAELMESRRVPVRMHLLGYGAAEIADRLGWSSAKTRNLLSRGLADLREHLRARGIGPETLS